jgi:hypothetical protein
VVRSRSATKITISGVAGGLSGGAQWLVGLAAVGTDGRFHKERVAVRTGCHRGSYVTSPAPAVSSSASASLQQVAWC